MHAQQAIDITRDALLTASLVAAPVLVAGALIGLIIGLLQALTQIQEQTVAFVPKLAAMAIALAFSLPWIMSQLINYAEQLISEIPNRL